MGVLPLVFQNGQTRQSLRLDGSETLDIEGIAAGITPGMDALCTIHRQDGSRDQITLTCRIDTLDEVDYFRHGGILHYVLRQLLAASEPAASAD
jgi:aconitate hydratase